MPGGVRTVHAPGENGDRSPADGQRGAVSRPVDAVCPAGDDRRLRGGQISGEVGGDALPVGGGRPGAHDGDACSTGQELGAPAYPQHHRRLRIEIVDGERPVVISRKEQTGGRLLRPTECIDHSRGIGTLPPPRPRLVKRPSCTRGTDHRP